MNIIRLFVVLLTLIFAHTGVALAKKKESTVRFAPPGGYEGLVNKVNYVDGQNLEIFFTPYELGSDRWNLVPPVIPGTEIRLIVACLDSPLVTCFDANRILSDAKSSQTIINFVIEQNAGTSFISEFVPLPFYKKSQS